MPNRPTFFKWYESIININIEYRIKVYHPFFQFSNTIYTNQYNKSNQYFIMSPCVVFWFVLTLTKLEEYWFVPAICVDRHPQFVVFYRYQKKHLMIPAWPQHLSDPSIVVSNCIIAIYFVHWLDNKRHTSISKYRWQRHQKVDFSSIFRFSLLIRKCFFFNSDWRIYHFHEWRIVHVNFASPKEEEDGEK